MLLQQMVHVESRGLETRVQASWVDRGHGRTRDELSGALMNRSLPAAMVNACAHDPGPGRTIDPMIGHRGSCLPCDGEVKHRHHVRIYHRGEAHE